MLAVACPAAGADQPPIPTAARPAGRPSARRPAIRRLTVTLLLTIAWAFAGPCLPAESVAEEQADDNTWLLIDTAAQVLIVYVGASPVERFEGISIGRGGASASRRRGDGSTPTGRYRVSWINDDSPFRRFFGLNYPNREQAERAYRDRRIGTSERDAILQALRTGTAPPANTVLGGRIGIHGLGRGDPAIHARFNWTRGCIALTNRQIDQLGRWVRRGTPVVIR